MRLFTVGPVQMYKETLDVRSLQLPYFRTSAFSEIMLENENLLKLRLGATEDFKMIFLTASGTGAMEASVINCFDEKDRLLIVDGGSFGRRFCEICDVHRIPYDSIKLEWNEELTQDKVLEYTDNIKYSALLVNADETSTGQLFDLCMLSQICRDNGMYFIVDAISSFGADYLDVAEMGIDACIISSQKAMSLAPGMSMIAISNSLYEERVLKQPRKTLYFDFREHIDNQKRGQTPFTPAVGVLLELNEYLKRQEKDSKDRVEDNAKYFRRLLSDNGFDIPTYPLSNALTPVLLNPHAFEYFTLLKDQYDLFVTPCGGVLKDVIVRVGHLGAIDKTDYDNLINAMVNIRTRIQGD